MDLYSDRVTVPPVVIPTQKTPLMSSPPSSSSSPPLSSYRQSPPSRDSKSSKRSRPPTPPPAVVLSPCAACKILRRRCAENCVLAPYFPPTDPYKFTIAHRVFGASNIIKFLQELPESQRADAVSSMVYEANARIRDPVYGCTRAICHLHKQVTELQEQLAKSQAELATIQCQHRNLLSFICMQMNENSQEPMNMQQQQQQHQQFTDTSCLLLDDNNTLGPTWDEPLWT